MPPKNERTDDASELWRLSGMGLEFAGVLGGMIVLGWLLDRWLGTGPWFLIGGLAFGLVGGTIRFVLDAVAANRRAQRAYRRDHPAGAGTGRAIAGEDDGDDWDDDERRAESG